MHSFSLIADAKMKAFCDTITWLLIIAPLELCAVDCGSHGVCSGGVCQCEDGWGGASCEERTCHPNCAEHGQCKDGKCECSPGWEGEQCTIGEFPASVLLNAAPYVTVMS